jgi:hypothetical protein
VNFVLKLLHAKKRHDIRDGKLWEITRVWGIDVFKEEKQPARPEPLIRRPECDKVDAMRVHIIKGEDNVTNLTKKPELL